MSQSVQLADARPPRRVYIGPLTVIAILGIATVILWASGARIGPEAFRAAPHAPDLGLLARQPPVILLHLGAALTALAIGIVQMIGVKGTTMHRFLGWTWVLAMGTTAVSSLFIRELNHGQFSYIHLLSGWTIIALPMAVAFIRGGHVRLHARFMTGIFVGGLLIAGLMAFLPGRLMWKMFFG